MHGSLGFERSLEFLLDVGSHPDPFRYRQRQIAEGSKRMALRESESVIVHDVPDQNPGNIDQEDTLRVSRQLNY